VIENEQKMLRGKAMKVRYCKLAFSAPISSFPLNIVMRGVGRAFNWSNEIFGGFIWEVPQSSAEEAVLTKWCPRAVQGAAEDKWTRMEIERRLKGFGERIGARLWKDLERIGRELERRREQFPISDRVFSASFSKKIWKSNPDFGPDFGRS